MSGTSIPSSSPSKPAIKLTYNRKRGNPTPTPSPDAECLFDKLPDSLFTEILVRLPAVRGLRCKFVSTRWKSVIQHPFFLKKFAIHRCENMTLSVNNEDFHNLNHLKEVVRELQKKEVARRNRHPQSQSDED